MVSAQKLYENGDITYMRTDSHAMSSEFQRKLCDYIGDTWSPGHYKQTKTGKKVKGAQEAHECIRVTNLEVRLSGKYSNQDKKIYGLIKRYTITSQMIPARYNMLTITLTTEESKDKGTFRVTNRVLSSKGFLSYYDGTEKEYQVSEQLVIPSSTSFTLRDSRCIYSPESPPAYYDESDIVKTLESSGIGRPSTYTSILNTVYSRNYTEIKTIPPREYEIRSLTLRRDDEIVTTNETLKTRPQRHKIVLTDLGKQVLVYLMANFSHILSISFTSQVEEDLDRIHRGEVEWSLVVKKVYDSFIKDVTIQKSLKSQKSQKSHKGKTPIRDLGEFQGSPVLLKVGPYGPYISHKDKTKTLKYFLQISEKPMEDLMLEDVLDIVRYPLVVGFYQGGEMIIKVGPHGKYLTYKGRNYRLPTKENYTCEDCVAAINR
jgi:DNA topoisomerase-1